MGFLFEKGRVGVSGSMAIAREGRLEVIGKGKE